MSILAVSVFFLEVFAGCGTRATFPAISGFKSTNFRNFRKFDSKTCFGVRISSEECFAPLSPPCGECHKLAPSLHVINLCPEFVIDCPKNSYSWHPSRMLPLMAKRNFLSEEIASHHCAISQRRRHKAPRSRKIINTIKNYKKNYAESAPPRLWAIIFHTVKFKLSMYRAYF